MCNLYHCPHWPQFYMILIQYKSLCFCSSNTFYCINVLFTTIWPDLHSVISLSAVISWKSWSTESRVVPPQILTVYTAVFTLSPQSPNVRKKVLNSGSRARKLERAHLWSQLHFPAIYISFCNNRTYDQVWICLGYSGHE